jgi:mannitol-1-phosphate 5-dehydrogenase
VDGRKREAVAQEIADCAVVCTAVGAGALPHIAPALAAGLSLRFQQRGGPLNTLICENLHDARDILRGLVAQHLPPEMRETVLAQTGFVQAVVSRMVPLQTEEDRQADPLAIKVEAYKRLPIDARAIVGALPKIVGVEPVDNFEAYVERKLYTHNCAHATLGYLGYRHGFQYGYQALVDPAIRQRLEEALEETGAALILKHGFDAEAHRAHIADLMERFANTELGDTCFRLARDPIRKLAPDDRLTGAARLCESQEVTPRALSQVIAAALRFDAPDDPTAVALQTQIAEKGLHSVLESVCGIAPAEPLGRLVLAAYEGDAS